MDLLKPGFGLEQVGYGALGLLINNLNDYIDEIEGEWTDVDEDFAVMRGLPYEPVTIEHVEPQNFYFGSKPSLIEETTPLDTYPAVTVVPHRSVPAGTDNGDHNYEHNTLFYVEIFVKASPDEGEEVCNKRTHRTADAVMRVIMDDPTLGGAVYELGTSPSLIVSEPFFRPANASEGYGEDWFWQAARIDYTADKYSPFTTTGG